MLGISLFLVLTARSARHGGTTGDFPIFYHAALGLERGENIYNRAPEAGVDGTYLYPPSLAMLFVPLAKLGQAGCAWAWAWINAGMLLVVLLVGAREMHGRLTGPAEKDARLGWSTGATVLAVALLGLVLTIGKVRSVIGGGQTDLLVVLGVLLGLVWCERRPALSGAAIALACVIKYTPILFVGYLLVRGRWRAAAWSVAFLAVFAVLPALVCGWDQNLRLWGIALGGVSRVFGSSVATETAATVQDAAHPLSISITSALTRAMLPTPGAGVALLGAALVGLGLLGATWRMYAARGFSLLRRPRGTALPALMAMEWAGVIVAMLAFSPHTQGRHLVLLIVVNLFCAALLLAARPGRAALVALLLGQVAMNFPPTGMGMDGLVAGWRAIGGAGWCVALMWLGVAWAGLARARTLESVPAIRQRG